MLVTHAVLPPKSLALCCCALTPLLDLFGFCHCCRTLSLLPLLSLQAIMLAACFPTDWPLLVVCPTSLLSSWAVELEAWLPPLFKAPGGQPVILTIRSDKDRKKLLGAGEGTPPALSASAAPAAHACRLPHTSIDCHRVRRRSLLVQAAFGMYVCFTSQTKCTFNTRRTLCRDMLEESGGTGH